MSTLTIVHSYFKGSAHESRLTRTLLLSWEEVVVEATVSKEEEVGEGGGGEGGRGGGGR